MYRAAILNHPGFQVCRWQYHEVIFKPLQIGSTPKGVAMAISYVNQNLS
jgi:hypothetical protein